MRRELADQMTGEPYVLYLQLRLCIKTSFSCSYANSTSDSAPLFTETMKSTEHLNSLTYNSHQSESCCETTALMDRFWYVIDVQRSVSRTATCELALSGRSFLSRVPGLGSIIRSFGVD